MDTDTHDKYRYSITVLDPINGIIVEENGHFSFLEKPLVGDLIRMRDKTDHQSFSPADVVKRYLHIVESQQDHMFGECKVLNLFVCNWNDELQWEEKKREQEQLEEWEKYWVWKKKREKQQRDYDEFRGERHLWDESDL